jgi:hypothetical protein
MATKKTKKAPAGKQVKKAAAKKPVKKATVKKTVKKVTPKKVVKKVTVKKQAAKKAIVKKVAIKKSNAKKSFVACPMPCTYRLTPPQQGQPPVAYYRVTYNNTNNEFEIRDYNTNNLICTIPLVNNQYLKVRVTNSAGVYSVTFSNTNPSGTGINWEYVQGNGTNDASINFVRNTFWYPNTQASPIYKIIGADDERNLVLNKPDNQIISNCNMINAKVQSSDVYIRYEALQNPKYHIGATAGNVAKALHTANPKPSQIFKQKSDQQ